jgi:hypothetical protein
MAKSSESRAFPFALDRSEVAAELRNETDDSDSSPIARILSRIIRERVTIRAKPFVRGLGRWSDRVLGFTFKKRE